MRIVYSYQKDSNMKSPVRVPILFGALLLLIALWLYRAALVPLPESPGFFGVATACTAASGLVLVGLGVSRLRRHVA